ncbi:MAG: cysteine synthase family protein [Myxococcota bacterium]
MSSAKHGPKRPLELIGHTPLVELGRVSPPGVRIFAKLEGQNPTGSIKDRIARRIVFEAEQRGVLRPGMRLVEASTGNTAIALAMIAKQRGYDLTIVLPHGVVPSVPQMLGTFGVDIVWCPPEAGTKGAIDMARALADADPEHVWAVQQFSSTLNIDTHYHQTGREIVEALGPAHPVDVLVAGIGTGGTIMGCGRAIREAYPAARIVGLEPALGEHLQGLRHIEDSFVPPPSTWPRSGRWIVTAADALNAAKRVAEAEGLLVGVSSGATLHIAWKEAQRLGRDGIIVCVFSDSGWKYLPAEPWEAAARQSTALDEVHWW